MSSFFSSDPSLIGFALVGGIILCGM
jgi:hypothetical protein